MLVPGLVDPAEAEELLAHAAECDWCGEILREAAQDLADPPTDEEEEIARGTKFADPNYRQALAERLAGSSTSERRRTVRWWWPAAAGLATAMVVGVVGYEQWGIGAGGTARLLAKAYTERRQMDVRLPGAVYSQKHLVMAGESSSIDKPPALDEAWLNIKRGIRSHPEDPRWLQLEGRAELLENKEDAAIVELDRARALRPADASILADLGAAYFQKAEKTGDDPEYFKKAFEVLSQGAHVKPDDPVLAFNRALAAEQILTPNVAREAWEKYLELDPHSGWAAEAREHRDKVKKN